MGISALVTFIMISIKVGDGFIPEIQMPFKKVVRSSTTEIKKIGSTLICDEQRNSLKGCATECLNKSLTSTGCHGFYSNSTEKNICFLCRVSNSSEIVNNLNATLSENSNFYLLRHNKIKPEISVNFENYSGNTIYGEGVVGTTVDVVDSDHVEGIKGKGLYLHDGVYVRLTGSGTECWTKLEHCSSGMSVSGSSHNS